jgi:hypothetical protein
MVKPRRASVSEVCSGTSVPHAVGFKQQFGSSFRDLITQPLQRFLHGRYEA